MSNSFASLTDEELAAIVIEKIVVLETLGARLPEGWRHQPISLSYLDALHEMALTQLKSMPRER